MKIVLLSNNLLNALYLGKEDGLYCMNGEIAALKTRSIRCKMFSYKMLTSGILIRFL